MSRWTYLLPAGLAFALLGFSSRFQARVTVNPNAPTVINESLERFAQGSKPLREVNLSGLRDSRAGPELRVPDSALPGSHLHSYSEISRLFLFSKRCDRSLRRGGENLPLKKAWLWHSFLCDQAEALPPAFFEKTPFIHPSGKSFVSLAVTSGRFKDPEWLRKHSNGLHLLELPELTEVSPGRLSKLLSGVPFLAGPKEVWIKKKTASGTEAIQYRVFSRPDWERFSGAQSYMPAVQGCPIAIEGTCWVENATLANRITRWIAIAAVLAAGILGLALVILILRRNIAKRREMEQRTFVLQLLAHELRTPATGMRLSLEALRSDFDQLPASSQKAFLQLCDQAQRLSRVTDASTQYLGASRPSGKLSLSPREIPSLNEFSTQCVAQAAGDRAKEVQLSLLEADRSVWIDPYWVEVCLSNLVLNALLHGQAPVSVSVVEARNGIAIRVQDNGQIRTSKLEDLTGGKLISENRGMGLGLSIIQTIVEAMNGRLSFVAKPTTTFTIEIPETKA